MTSFDHDPGPALVAARTITAELAADVVELRARNLCREAEPHEARAVPCPAHVVEARRQLGGDR